MGDGPFASWKARPSRSHKIAPDETGVLFIDDPRSDYSGMEAARFRKYIVLPMGWEYSIRERAERKAAQKEDRPMKKIPYPEAGIWNRESDSIEYPADYTERTLDKIKKAEKE